MRIMLRADNPTPFLRRFFCCNCEIIAKAKKIRCPLCGDLVSSAERQEISPEIHEKYESMEDKIERLHNQMVAI